MKFMNGGDLQKLLQQTGKRWAVAIAEVEGKPRACIITLEGTLFAMDKEMLREAMPMLQKALDGLEAGALDSKGGIQ